MCNPAITVVDASGVSLVSAGRLLVILWCMRCDVHMVCRLVTGTQ